MRIEISAPNSEHEETEALVEILKAKGLFESHREFVNNGNGSLFRVILKSIREN